MTPLTSRDDAILDHVHRYRLSTPDFLQREFFPGSTPSAVSKVTARLVAESYLIDRQLRPGFRYYVLGGRGAALLGADPRSARRFTEQSLPLAYGLLAFCIANGLIRLTSSEFQESFPELVSARSQTSGYFRDTREDRPRLGMVLLDRGSPPKQILRKIDRLILQRYRNPSFLSLIQSGHFSITILTAWPVKQQYLLSALRRLAGGPTRLQVEVVPELQLFFRRI